MKESPRGYLTSRPLWKPCLKYPYKTVGSIIIIASYNNYTGPSLTSHEVPGQKGLSDTTGGLNTGHQRSGRLQGPRGLPHGPLQSSTRCWEAATED